MFDEVGIAPSGTNGREDRAGTRRGRRLPCAAAFMLLITAAITAGCSDPDRPPEEQTKRDSPGNLSGVAPTPEAPATQDVPSSSAEPDMPDAADGGGADQTIGGDGSQIELSTLSAEEIEAAKLGGELGCSFTASGSAPILIAMGDVASRAAAQGIVKVGSFVERVTAPGGFDAMLKGGAFSGAGKTIRVALTGPATNGGESPPRPATLTYERADGARRTWAGEWTCGP